MTRIEIVAAAFLIPTLIVGFWGANTWLPGQQRHWRRRGRAGAVSIRPKSADTPKLTSDPARFRLAIPHAGSCFSS